MAQLILQTAITLPWNTFLQSMVILNMTAAVAAAPVHYPYAVHSVRRGGSGGPAGAARCGVPASVPQTELEPEQPRCACRPPATSGHGLRGQHLRSPLRAGSTGPRRRIE